MTVTIRHGDCREVLRTLPDQSVHCCVTSPPYFGLRDYGHAGQIGLEPTPDTFAAEMVAVFREVRRVLRDDGTLWLNLGDCYTGSSAGQRSRRMPSRTSDKLSSAAVEALGARIGVPEGLKPKELVGIPWRVAFALQADGWYLRKDIIWSKPNAMPESVRDRPTAAHEYLFLFSKYLNYQYDQDSIREGGRNARSIWDIPTRPFYGAHFATMPVQLAERCIKAGCAIGGTVLDPFGGTGTTGLAAQNLSRSAILIELNPEYAAMAERRIRGDAGMFAVMHSDVGNVGRTKT